jgi:hypothetical protein
VHPLVTPILDDICQYLYTPGLTEIRIHVRTRGGHTALCERSQLECCYLLAVVLFLKFLSYCFR